jgi:hypothetical protein
VWPKIIKSLKEEPGKRGIFRDLRPAKVGLVNTGIFDPDVDRLLRVVGNIGRALYYAMFIRIWSDQVHVFPPSTSFLELNNIEGNEARKIMEEGFEKLLGGIPRFGQNPDIFSFQYFGDHESGIMRQTYFEGVSLLVVFGEQTQVGGLFDRLAEKVGISNPDSSNPEIAANIQATMLKKYPINRRVGVHSRLN